MQNMMTLFTFRNKSLSGILSIINKSSEIQAYMNSLNANTFPKVVIHAVRGHLLPYKMPPFVTQNAVVYNAVCFNVLRYGAQGYAI